jgi:hypothetical protein
LREVLPFCAAQGLPHRLPENYLVRVERETSRCLLSGQLEIGTAFPPLPELLNRFIATFFRLAELLNRFILFAIQPAVCQLPHCAGHPISSAGELRQPGDTHALDSFCDFAAAMAVRLGISRCGKFDSLDSCHRPGGSGD